MKKAVQIGFIAVFLLILVVPVLFLNTKTEQKSDIDNRYLQEFPKWDKNFTNNFETYLTDRVGGRNEMINFYTKANDSLFNIMSHPSYQYGKDGYIYLRLDERPSDEYIAKFNAMLGEMDRYFEERGVEFIFMLNPSKFTVYSEHRPAGMNFDYEWVSQITDYCDENGIDYYYAKDDLIEAKAEYPVFNQKYDAGHWNNDGALLACTNLIEQMKLKNASIKSVDPNLYSRKITVKETLTNSTYVINEDYASYNFIDSETGADVSPDDYVNFQYWDCLKYDSSHSHIKYFPNKDGSKAPSMMIFKGSYFDALRFQFLFPSFSESYWLQNYHNVHRFDYFYNVFKPDVVIYETAEYVILPTYFKESDLDSVEVNPLITKYAETPVGEFATVTPVDFEKITDLPNMSDDAATTMNYTISGEKCKYAYITIDGEVFEMELSTDENGVQTIMATVKREVAENAKSAEIMLVSEDEQVKDIEKVL